jgi:hypothetical protein
VAHRGTAKPFFLEGLGQLAVEAGLKVAWFSLEELGVLVRRHRADDSVTKAVQAILAARLVVVDDIGLLPVSPDAAEGVLSWVDAACLTSGESVRLAQAMAGKGITPLGLLPREAGHAA